MDFGDSLAHKLVESFDEATRDVVCFTENIFHIFKQFIKDKLFLMTVNFLSHTDVFPFIFTQVRGWSCFWVLEFIHKILNDYGC